MVKFEACKLLVGDRIHLPIDREGEDQARSLEGCIVGIARHRFHTTLMFESPEYVHTRGPGRSTPLVLEITLPNEDPVDILEAVQTPHETRYTRFWTESGSEYLIDHDEHIWQRGENPDSPNVRTVNGVYIRISQIRIDEPVVMLCPPLEDGALARQISTTRVLRVSHE